MHVFNFVYVEKAIYLYIAQHFQGFRGEACLPPRSLRSLGPPATLSAFSSRPCPRSCAHSSQIAHSSCASGSFLVAAGLPRAGTHCAPGLRGARLRPLAAVPRAAAAARPAPPRPAPAAAGLAEGGVAEAAAASTAARAVGAKAPEQHGGAGAARPRSGLSRRPPTAGGPLQPPARAPVSSAALSGRGRREAEGAGSPARVSAPAWPRSRGAVRPGRRGPEAEVSGVGVGGRLGGVRAPSPRAQGHGGDGARRQGHVRPPCEPGQRDRSPARPGAAAGRWARGRGRRPCRRPAEPRRACWELSAPRSLGVCSCRTSDTADLSPASNAPR